MSREIRDMERRDCEAVLDINRQAIPKVFELDAGEFSVMLGLSEYAKVVEIDRQVAGYIFALARDLDYDGAEYRWFCRHSRDDFLYIDQVAIGQPWQGTGCGKRLYRDLENYAVRKRKTALVCEVNYAPPNHASLAFHEKLGFGEVTRMEIEGTVVSLLAKRALFEHN